MKDLPVVKVKKESTQRLKDKATISFQAITK